MIRLTALIYDHGKAIFAIETLKVWSQLASALEINLVTMLIRNWIVMTRA
jgi:hypothetical protein